MSLYCYYCFYYNENIVDIFKVVLWLNCKLAVYMGGSENTLFSVIFIYLIKPKVEVMKTSLLIYKKNKDFLSSTVKEVLQFIVRSLKLNIQEQ